ncbi:transposase [Bradyrhizobium sp. 157]|nr:transposase [Bradyrhizobium sp. 157]
MWDFLRGLKERGPRAPLLGICDGALGLIRAFTDVFGKSLRQRCLAHAGRNVLANADCDEVAQGARGGQGGDQEGLGPSSQDRRAARRARRGDRARRRSRRHTASATPPRPSALTNNIKELTTYLRFPMEHRESIRHVPRHLLHAGPDGERVHEDDARLGQGSRPSGACLHFWADVADNIVHGERFSPSDSCRPVGTSNDYPSNVCTSCSR